MRVEEKVLRLLKRGPRSATDIASEILVSPKKVLKAIEYLENQGLLKCNSSKHDVNTVHHYET
jgi:predicted ArsR family transcriptional regulator